jgi:hypothetical protein
MRLISWTLQSGSEQLVSHVTKNDLYKNSLIYPNQYYNQYKACGNLFDKILRANKKLHNHTKLKQFAKNTKIVGVTKRNDQITKKRMCFEHHVAGMNRYRPELTEY